MQPPRNLEEIPDRVSYLIPQRTYRTYIWFDKYILTKVAQKRWMHSGGSVHAPKMPAEGGMISCKATRREGNNCATAYACRDMLGRRTICRRRPSHEQRTTIPAIRSEASARKLLAGRQATKSDWSFKRTVRSCGA